jgi:hypothetical protein
VIGFPLARGVGEVDFYWFADCHLPVSGVERSSKFYEVARQ